MTTERFYDDLAQFYHLIYEDWDRSIARQAGILGPLIEQRTGLRRARVLDCACGIGTQALGLAARGHVVFGCDLSRASIERAAEEARRRGLSVAFQTADMRSIDGVADNSFDVVMAADNALPHLLRSEDRARALEAMARKLKPGGILLATVRDYDRLIVERPKIQTPAFYGEPGARRIVHQVWDWDGDEYDLHLHIACEESGGWTARHFVSRYHALTREELNASLTEAGFDGIEWLEPATTSFHQLIVMAKKTAG